MTRELQVAFKESLKVAALLVRGEATEHVNSILDEARTVSITL